MFRLTQYMQELVHPTPVRRRAGTPKPVVIWNLTRRCNLRCRHCYTTSADVHFPGELTHEQAMGVLDDLKAFGIPALILSGANRCRASISSIWQSVPANSGSAISACPRTARSSPNVPTGSPIWASTTSASRSTGSGR